MTTNSVYGREVRRATPYTTHSVAPRTPRTRRRPRRARRGRADIARKPLTRLWSRSRRDRAPREAVRARRIRSESPSFAITRTSRSDAPHAARARQRVARPESERRRRRRGEGRPLRRRERRQAELSAPVGIDTLKSAYRIVCASSPYLSTDQSLLTYVDAAFALNPAHRLDQEDVPTEKDLKAHQKRRMKEAGNDMAFGQVQNSAAIERTDKMEEELFAR